MRSHLLRSTARVPILCVSGGAACQPYLSLGLGVVLLVTSFLVFATVGIYFAYLMSILLS